MNIWVFRVLTALAITLAVAFVAEVLPGLFNFAGREPETALLCFLIGILVALRR